MKCSQKVPHSSPSTHLFSVSIYSDNGLLPIRQLSTVPLGTNFNDILFKIQNVSFNKIYLKISPAGFRVRSVHYMCHCCTGIMKYSVMVDHVTMRPNCTSLYQIRRLKWPPFWQTTFLRAFSLMKSLVFWFEFHWSLLLRVLLTISQHWFR